LLAAPKRGRTAGQQRLGLPAAFGFDGGVIGAARFSDAPRLIRVQGLIGYRAIGF